MALGHQGQSHSSEACIWPPSSLAARPRLITALTWQLNGFLGWLLIVRWTAVQAKPLCGGGEGSLKWNVSSSGRSLFNKELVTRPRVFALLRQGSLARPASPPVYFLTPPLFLALAVAPVKLYDILRLSKPTIVHQRISPILRPLVAAKISAFSAQRIKNMETEFGRNRKMALILCQDRVEHSLKNCALHS